MPSFGTMERTREIPRAQWHPYLDRLSRAAVDHPIRIEVENRDIGDQELGTFLPLNGIEVDPKGSEAGDIEISVQSEPKGMLSHYIDAPQRLYIEETEAGELLCMEVEERAGGKTLIYFQRPIALPAGTAEHEREVPFPGP